MTAASARGLAPYALFAATISAAGLPIYIHAPKVYSDSYGVGLAALGGVLSGLRLLDVVQDPFFGWIAARLGRWRGVAVGVGAVVLGAAMVLLFAVEPMLPPLLWFALTLTALFSSFSFLTIAFYARGVAKAESLGAGGHVRLAAWRETGALVGICLAAVAPTLLMGTGSPYGIFAIVFAGVAVAAAVSMRGEWGRVEGAGEAPGFRVVLRDRTARRLLAIALLNAAPVAVTSTLFLYYVESRLGAPGWEGPLLLIFFLAAAGSAPAWGRIAAARGAKPTLLAGMVLSIAAFAWALFLGEGDTWAFAAVCVASGAALGADMTLLPAIFAARMARVAPEAGEAFGLWSVVQKATLALAAATLLPVLEAVGFEVGAAPSPERALLTLTLLYAGLPCLLKLAAIALLSVTRVEET